VARLEKSAAVKAPPGPVEWLPFQRDQDTTRRRTEPIRQLEDGSFHGRRRMVQLNDAYRLLGTIEQAAVPAVRLTVLPRGWAAWRVGQGWVMAGSLC
jgi:cobalamin biosynthesis protein CobT